MSFKLKHVVLVGLILFSEVIAPKIHAKELKIKEWVSPSTKIKFLKIPAGCFLMGSNNGKILRDKEIIESCGYFLLIG